MEKDKIGGGGLIDGTTVLGLPSCVALLRWGLALWPLTLRFKRTAQSFLIIDMRHEAYDQINK